MSWQVEYEMIGNVATSFLLRALICMQDPNLQLPIVCWNVVTESAKTSTRVEVLCETNSIQISYYIYT